MPVDPDGYDATSAATAAKMAAAERDRVATLLAGQRDVRSALELELEPDNYYDSDDGSIIGHGGMVGDGDDEHDHEMLSLMRETAGFDGGMSRRSSSSLPASSRRSAATTSSSWSSWLPSANGPTRCFNAANSSGSTLRNVLLIAGLAIATFLLVDNEDIMLAAQLQRRRPWRQRH